MRRVIRAPCPVCKNEIEFVYQTENIPYFSDILLIRARCDCGYRYLDTMILGEAEPVRWTLAVTEPGDLEVRVVRSTTGMITIPEFGLRVDPGPACEAFITNVEGVLSRFENAVVQFLSWAEEEEEIRRATDLKEEIKKARNGRIPFTIIIEDPDGNSAIISPKAEKEALERTGE